MATKTISIDSEAYDTLRRARARPSESFSQVIKRGHWESARSTAAALLDRLERSPIPDDETPRYLDDARDADLPPGDAWSE